MLYACRDWICITFRNHIIMQEGRNILYSYVHSFKDNTATQRRDGRKCYIKMMMMMKIALYVSACFHAIRSNSNSFIFIFILQYKRQLL